MARDNKINILQYTKIQTITFAIVGLVAGIIYSFGGLIIDTLVSAGLFTTTETPGLSYGTFLAFGALFGMPFLFAIFGILSGLIGAFLFNLFSKWLVGVELNLKK
jgi:hypothetical protein